MRNNLDELIPEERVIDQLLSGFRPQPSSRYVERMRTAPWQDQDQAELPQVYKNWAIRLKPAWVFVAFILILAFISIFLVPSFRVVADQFIHFFLPAASDKLEVRITPDNPLAIMDFSNPINFPLSLDEVRQQVGFKVKAIPPSPLAPSFIGARYEPTYNAVILQYKGEDYILLVTQRPLGSSQDVFSIGSNAQVEFVYIGNIQGEYVIGGWNAISNQIPSEIPTSPETSSINAVWDNTVPQFTLRWQDSGIAYEIRSNGENSPDQSQLISWANELK